MSRRTVETTIGGVRYESTVMPADYGIKVAVDLARTIGPGTAALVESLGQAIAGGQPEPIVARAIEYLVANANSDHVLDLIQRLLAFTTADGQRIDLAEHFAGQYEELAQVLKWIVMEVNKFQGFINGFAMQVLGGIAAIREAAREAAELGREA